MSGHGFKLSPAVGEMMAALITGQPPPVNPHRFASTALADHRCGRHFRLVVPGRVLAVVTTRIRILILLLLAMVCFAIVTTSGLAYNHYAIHYGRHGWGPPEVAFLLHYLLFGAASVLLLGVALDLAVGRRLTEAFDRLTTLSARSAWSLTALASVLVFGLVTLSRYGLLRDTAITDDENVYTFTAQLIASGQLFRDSLPEPVRPFFNNQFIVNNGKWYGIYFPGHSVLLALGERWN